MNRKQAEHILDAYVLISDEDAVNALREVILDAMTDYRNEAFEVLPGITIPSTNYPKNWDYTPKITCTGVDPMSRFNTAEVSK